MKRWKLPDRFRTIYWQNFMLTAGVVLFTVFLLSTSFFAVSYSVTVDKRSAELQKDAEIVSGMLSEYMKSGSLDDVRDLAHFASSVTNVDFLVCNTAGSVVLTTDEALAGKGDASVPQKIFDSVERGQSYVGRSTLGGIYPEKRFTVGVPVFLGEKTVGMVLAVASERSLTGLWHTFVGVFMITVAASLLLAFAASAWTSMRQTRPIRAMVTATRRYAEGDFNTRIEEYGAGEIGELASSFNQMADSLQETERQRREFIANVSHELKTPMTTIAGYTDGILDGTVPPQKEREYLHVISEESRRLSRLVRRMLEVSQLQSRDILREKAPFDICESMRRALISLEGRITDRGLDVRADLPDAAVTVLGDKELITQVIYNLLENAVKFARPASLLYLGISVANNGKAIVTVCNEGDTIPPEEIPLLFERFHKSDRSRSADKDGVGLGLYIVKTILEKHGEHIMVTSENGKTAFTFTMQTATML